MNICFIAWEHFGVGGVSRVLTRIMNALCREHEISVYCLRRPPLENAYGLDLENIRFFHHEMNVYEKMRRSVMDRLVTRTPCSPPPQAPARTLSCGTRIPLKSASPATSTATNMTPSSSGPALRTPCCSPCSGRGFPPAPESSPGPTRPMKTTSGSRAPISPVTSAMRSSGSTTASTKSSSCRTTTGGTLKRASTWQRGASTTRPASRRNGIPR